jgi:hypothetical protein
MLIIADREVRPVMGPAAFPPGEGAGDNGFRDIEQGLELEDLHEIRIKHPPFILYHNGPGSMGQCSECRERSRHGVVSPNETQIEAHQLAEFFPNLPGSDRSLLCQQALNATLLGYELVCCEGLWRNGSSVFPCSDSSAPTEHNRFQK